MTTETKQILVFPLAIILVISGYYIFASFQNKEKETQVLLANQQKILTDQKNVSNQTRQQISELRKKINDQNEILKKNVTNSHGNGISSTNEIMASDLKPYLTGVGQIVCDLGNGDAVAGSGSLWVFDNQRYVLTNQHVVSEQNPNNNCMFSVDGLDTNDSYVGDYNIYPGAGKNWNNKTDVTIMTLYTRSIGPKGTPIEKLNYSISSLLYCPSNIALGSPVTIIGYPASTEMNGINNFNNNVFTFPRTVTNGVVSAYETTVMDQASNNLPSPNYFVSNKIDHGNSGGIALSKYNGSLCVLGIPTWLNRGVSDSQGIVQNIRNIMYVPK